MSQCRRFIAVPSVHTSGRRTSGLANWATLGWISWGCRLFTLSVLFGVLAFATNPETDGEDGTPFHAVLFTCVYGRETLTEYVLRYYAGVREALLENHGMVLDMFVTGSDNQTTPILARRHGAAFADHPNSPLGAKHNLGLASMRDHYIRCDEGPCFHPDVVIIVGSDDILNEAFFVHVRNAFRRRPMSQPLHAVGLRDLYVMDLASQRLAYTRGYRTYTSPLDATIGCGRVYTWELLAQMSWKLWDDDRERSLDQSSVRRVAALLGPEVSTACVALSGRKHGLAAVDIKTSGFQTGTNIWSFDDLISAVGKKGRLYPFKHIDEPNRALDEHFGTDFTTEWIQKLRAAMVRLDTEKATSEECKAADSRSENQPSAVLFTKTCAAADSLQIA